MMVDMFYVAAFVLAAYAIWQHNNISIIARAAAITHCQKTGVQILDQNILLKKLAIARSPHSLFAFRRGYHFEFSSVGDQRYKGLITLVGTRIEEIELEAFKTVEPKH